MRNALLFLIALAVLCGCTQTEFVYNETQGFQISEVSLAPDPKPALLDYSSTETGSNQYDFESAKNAVSSVDLRLYGVFFKNKFEPSIEGYLALAGTSWSEAGNCEINYNYTSLKPKKDNVYCLKTSEGNVVKFIVGDMYLKENPYIVIYWVFRRAKDQSFPADKNAPSITALPQNSVNNMIRINLSEPLDYNASWTLLSGNITAIKYPLMLKCEKDVFYGALQQPGPYDALIFKTMDLPNTTCTAYLSGSVKDLNGNTALLNETWNLTPK